MTCHVSCDYDLDCGINIYKNLQNISFYSSSITKPPRSSAENIIAKKYVSPTQSSSPTLPHVYYKSFQTFISRITKLKLPEGWQSEISSDTVKIFMFDKVHSCPQLEIYVDTTLSFTIRNYSWSLPDDHEIYKAYKRSVKNITLSSLISILSSYDVCCGVSDSSLFQSVHLKKHIISKHFTLFSDESPLQQTEYHRSPDCILLKSNEGICEHCNNHMKKADKSLKRSALAITVPAKLNAPISLTSPERLKLTIQNYRIENKSLKLQISKLQEELSKSSTPVSSELSSDLVTIMSNADQSKISPFMKFFWEEQQKYLSTSKTGVRYHPMIIRYCLSLASKSPAAYDDIRYDEKSGTGFVVLPSRRRLRDYKNYIHPQRGFNKDIVNELKEKVKDFSETEKFVVLLFDEMKIQQNLVWDKHTGELIGFVDLGDIETNYATLEKVDDLASHVLVFLVRSIVNPFKFSLANFATNGATSAQMFPLFWKAVGICEIQCNLKVVAATCDGASPNRRLFRMHFHMTKADDINPDVDVTYRTLNVFNRDSEKRYIYFISDPPHLIKTARNCLSNSGAGRGTRFMWNGGMFIIWNHVADIFYEDRECGLHLLPKLTYEHIKLSSFSVMNVKLAAQVLSSSVSNVLNNFGPPEAAGTAKFCSMMDSFFDILNIRNTIEHKHDQKPFLVPFTSVGDARFVWLREVFLQYFKDWMQSINDRQGGNFSKNAKAHMFISWQTHEGIKLTVNSTIELVQFLLNNDVSYVLTERFCQDPLENYFGRQRSMGARKDNPSMRDFGYNDNTIRNQKIFRPIQGNVADAAVVEFSNEPVPCRKKHKANN